VNSMYNKVILMGRLTADPELKQTQNGKNYSQITVAIDRDYTPQGQEKQADFISVVAWEKTAEFISKYFCKGKMIHVDGSLRQRSYEKDGQKRYITEVLARDISFCGDKSDKPQTQQQTQPTQTNNAVTVGDFGDFEEVIGDSDLPF